MGADDGGMLIKVESNVSQQLVGQTVECPNCQDTLRLSGEQLARCFTQLGREKIMFRGCDTTSEDKCASCETHFDEMTTSLFKLVN